MSHLLHEFMTGQTPEPLAKYDRMIWRLLTTAVPILLICGIAGCYLHPLKPRAYQQQIGGAGHQQRDGEREVHLVAGGCEGRSHGPQNIGRF